MRMRCFWEDMASSWMIEDCLIDTGDCLVNTVYFRFDRVIFCPHLKLNTVIFGYFGSKNINRELLDFLRPIFVPSVVLMEDFKIFSKTLLPFFRHPVGGFYVWISLLIGGYHGCLGLIIGEYEVFLSLFKGKISTGSC